MRLRDLLDEASVKVGLESVDKEECMEEMVDMLVRAGHISDRGGALEALRRREALGTTGIGKGIGLPHGKHLSVSKLVAAMGISREGIEFDAADGEPVHMVILLLSNIQESGPHIRMLAEIARLLELPGFYRRAVASQTVAELIAVLEAEE